MVRERRSFDVDAYIQRTLGVPYDQQQFEALQIRNGILDIPDDEMADLARRISEQMR